MDVRVLAGAARAGGWRDAARRVPLARRSSPGEMVMRLFLRLRMAELSPSAPSPSSSSSSSIWRLRTPRALAPLPLLPCISPPMSPP